MDIELRHYYCGKCERLHFRNRGKVFYDHIGFKIKQDKFSLLDLKAIGIHKRIYKDLITLTKRYKKLVEQKEISINTQNKIQKILWKTFLHLEEHKREISKGLKLYWQEKREQYHE